MNVSKNDLEALKAAFAGVKTTAAKVLQMEAVLDTLQPISPGPDGEADAAAPTDLIRAATAHAIAAGALSGLLHRLYSPGSAAPASATELTDSAGENA